MPEGLQLEEEQGGLTGGGGRVYFRISQNGGTWMWMIPGSPSGFQLSNSPFRLPTWETAIADAEQKGVTML